MNVTQQTSRKQNRGDSRKSRFGSRAITRVQHPYMAGLLILTIMLTACATNETQITSPPSPTRTTVQLGSISTTSPTIQDQTSTISPTTPIDTPTLEMPTPVPIPPITSQDRSRGPLNATTNLIVYSDFQ
jgi:hypothetical protein